MTWAHRWPMEAKQQKPRVLGHQVTAKCKGTKWSLKGWMRSVPCGHPKLNSHSFLTGGALQWGETAEKVPKLSRTSTHKRKRHSRYKWRTRTQPGNFAKQKTLYSLTPHKKTEEEALGSVKKLSWSMPLFRSLGVYKVTLWKKWNPKEFKSNLLQNYYKEKENKTQNYTPTGNKALQKDMPTEKIQIITFW